MKLSIIPPALALSLGWVLQAGAEAPAITDPSLVGSQTKAWINLQKDPKLQSTEARPMPGEIADEVYKRYVASFKYPIPEQFKRQSTGSGGSGSSGGSNGATGQ